MKRRTFLATTSIAFPALLLGQAPSRKLRFAVAGMGGRGTQHALELAKLDGVEVAFVCDPDEKRAAAAAVAVEKRAGKAPKPVSDFRSILDDPSVDALTIATPNHWHAPAALLAMSAGKHVYLEKPCSHNAHEGALLVAAARKHDRRLQHGTQRRSWPGIREAIERLRAGEIGRVLSARAYYFNSRPSIGRGKPATPPEGLDWSLWQGPAPEKQFHDNYLHYHWHWFWHWGNGELGNNGVHMLDLCRWGLGVGDPGRVTSAGGKVRFPHDDQETPDTNTVTYEFATSAGPATITWENRSWASKTPSDPAHEVAFFGENGIATISGAGAVFRDWKGVELAKTNGPTDDKIHFQNFVDAIRGGTKLTAEIEEGHRTTLLCHLGNIAYRSGGVIQFDPDKNEIAGEAAKLWKREYREGWEPKV